VGDLCHGVDVLYHGVGVYRKRVGYWCSFGRPDRSQSWRTAGPG